MKSLRTYLMLLVAALAIVGCSAGAPESTASSAAEALLAPLGCSTDAQCRAAAQYQAGNCAKLSTGTCRSDNTCNYALDTSNSACHCIVGEERKCAAGGFQTCFQQSSGSDWPNGGCDTTYDNYTSASEIRSCASLIGCTDGYIPAGTDMNNISCMSAGPAGRQCLWNLAATSDEPDCTCVEGEVRDCYKYGGGTGHQTCYMTTGTSSNDWGHPTTWTACL